jgi:hypothetical protein
MTEPMRNKLLGNVVPRSRHDREPIRTSAYYLSLDSALWPVHQRS